MPIEPGQRLSHYRLMSKIGAGGMGEVYLAEDTTLKRKVALKVLPAAMASDPARLERLQREAEAIAALNHPNIVTIHSVEDCEGVRFLTMELVEGESLDHRITPGGLELTEVFDVGTAVADALAAAHNKGIVHRDLKPANVVVSVDGRVKVLDFGLAKFVAGSEVVAGLSAAATRPASLTGEGLIVGTVPYMSPEQLSGKAVDHRTDIFSLGVMLYELSVGRRPFVGDSTAELTSRILRDTPRPVNELREDVPRHLGRIIAHCLEKNPEARFQTAKDIGNELRGLRKEIESAMSEQRGAVAAPPPPVAVSAASARTSAPASVPSSMSSAGEARAGGSRQWLWAIGGTVVLIAVASAFWMGIRRGGESSTPDAPVKGANAREAGGAVTTVFETNSLAVLPFTNMSSDKNQEYFSDGLTEELLNVLVKIPDLKVVGRTSSFSFKGKNEDLRTIGQKLGVANLLEGSVRKSGNRIRITAQLVKTVDGFHLWSETYDRTLDDIFAVQDDIAKSVAAALKVTLLGKDADAPKPNVEAYDLVLQARFVLQNRTEEAILRGRGILERALKLSPDSSRAWAQLGIWHYRVMENATTVDARRQALERTRQALARALELDSSQAATNSRMAFVHLYSWDFAAAGRLMEQAQPADTKDTIVMNNAALLYSGLGRVDEAITLLERMLTIDPLDLQTYQDLASNFILMRRLDEAEALIRTDLKMEPNDVFAQRILGDINLMRGDWEAARKAYARFIELSGQGDYGRLFYAALVEHTAGNAAASQAAAAEFEKRFGVDDPAYCARIRSWRGETNAAFAWLDKAVASHDPNVALLRLDIYLTPLHADPRWNALLNKIGLPTD